MRKIALLLISIISFHYSFCQETEISFTSGDLVLYGTLSVPDGEGPFPTVVFVHGSGPNDRDQTIQLTGGNSYCLYPGIYNETIKNFQDLSNYLTDIGIATLRYDKRTFTYQTQLNPKEITPMDFVLDVNSAIDFVKTRPETDTTKIILLGHSQGANLIPIVANERNDISALLSLGTATRGIDSILAMQYRELYYYCLNDTTSGDSIYNSILSDFELIRNDNWDPNTPYLGAYKKFWRNWINITDSAPINYNLTTQPALFLHATEDFNIPIEDAQRYEYQLDKEIYSVYYLNDLNHFFTTATNPVVDMAVSDTIVSWLLQNSIITNIEEVNNSKKSYRLFDYGNRLKITFTNKDVSNKVSIYNINGTLVKKYNTIDHNSVEINKEDFKSGVYIITLKLKNQFVSRKVIL